MDELVLVDPQDTILGTAPKDLCHDGEGLLHRAFSIFVCCKKERQENVFGPVAGVIPAAVIQA